MIGYPTMYSVANIFLEELNRTSNPYFGQLNSKILAILLFILNLILAIVESTSRPVNLTTLIGVIIVTLFLSIMVKAIKEDILGRSHYFDYFTLTAALICIILGLFSNELIIPPPFCYPTSSF